MADMVIPHETERAVSSARVTAELEKAAIFHERNSMLFSRHRTLLEMKNRLKRLEAQLPKLISKSENSELMLLQNIRNHAMSGSLADDVKSCGIKSNGVTCPTAANPTADLQTLIGSDLSDYIRSYQHMTFLQCEISKLKNEIGSDVASSANFLPSKL